MNTVYGPCTFVEGCNRIWYMALILYASFGQQGLARVYEPVGGSPGEGLAEPTRQASYLQLLYDVHLKRLKRHLA